ncbi:hypothetical protein [Agromyces bauzanensis]
MSGGDTGSSGSTVSASPELTLPIVPLRPEASVQLPGVDCIVV